MTQLMILTSEFEPKNLTAALEAIHKQVVFEFLMADWWNGPGIFKDYTAGLGELKSKVTDCVSGSAFGAKAEICWRQVGDKFRAVLVAEQDTSTPLNPSNAGGVVWESSTETNRCEKTEESEVILWGTECIDDNKPIHPSTWVEARIPRLLEYPVEPEQKKFGDKDDKSDFEAVFLQIKAYYDARGRPIIYRRHGLRAQLESLKRKQQPQQAVIEEPKTTEETEEGITNGSV